MPSTLAINACLGATLPAPAGLKRCGVLVPWANMAVEHELPRIAHKSIRFHFARLVPSSRETALTSSFLQDLWASVPSALHSLSALPLSQVLLACTSAGFVDHIAGKAEFPVVDAFRAILASLRFLEWDSVHLYTPYPKPISDTEVSALQAAGIRVREHRCLGLMDGYRTIPSEEIIRLATPASQADGIVLSCTGWQTLEAATRIASAIGLPVITSNIALAIYPQL